MARRVRVNAKTLSKALTDLAAEGVLERSIGRGTFVKSPPDPAAASQGSAAPVVGERWLIICDPDQLSATIIRNLGDPRTAPTYHRMDGSCRVDTSTDYRIHDLGAPIPDDQWARATIVRD